MRASVYVGRVRGLAVALGIGAAVGGLGAGVAGASTEESTEPSAQTDSAASSATRAEASSSESRSRTGRSAAEQPSGGRESGAAGRARGPVAKNDSDRDAVLGRVESDALTSALSEALSDSTAFPTVQVLAQFAEDRRVLPAASAPAEVVPAAPVVISVSASVPEAVAEAPVMAPVVAAVGTVEAVDGDWSGSVPGAPGESAASWMMVAAARRETRNRAIVLDTAARTLAAGGVPEAQRLPVAAAAAAVVSGDSVQALAPVGAVSQGDPITAIFQQVQAVISGIVEAVTQFVNQVVTVVNQIVTAIVNIFVPVAPVNSPPTVAALSVGVPDSVTGAVTGVVSATDSDGDVLSYGALADTGKGIVVIDSATGAFTYVPTASARENAAKVGASDADKSDNFTVTVTDSKGGSADVSVSVGISPLATTPANSAPIAGIPTVGVPDTSTGVVHGKVNASDPDGDPLTYRAPSATAKGVVTINPDTGEFTYAPTAAARLTAASVGATAADKADAFTVTVTDARGGVTSVAVTVAVSPAITTPVNRAPVASTPIVGAPDATSGVVSGSVHAADPDGDTLTFGGTAVTSKGSVAVAADGNFTYTPTTAARQNAARDEATAAEKSDTFIVTVTDGHGGAVEVPVTVVVSPVVEEPVTLAPTIVTIPVGRYAFDVVVSRDGRWIYTANYDDGTVSVVDAQTMTVTRTIAVAPDWCAGVCQGPLALALSPDGSRLYTAGGTTPVFNSDGELAYFDGYGPVSIIDAASGAVIDRYDDDPWMGGGFLSTSPDGQRLYLGLSRWGSGQPDGIRVLDLATGTSSYVGVTSIVSEPSPDGKTIILADSINDGSVDAFDLASNSQLWSTRLRFSNRDYHGYALASAGARTYVSVLSSNSTGVAVLDSASGSVIAVVPTGPYDAYSGEGGLLHLGLEVSPDGTRVYLADDGNGTLSVIDTATNSLITTVELGGNPTGLAVSPDGRNVYVTDRINGTLSVISFS